MKAWRCRVGVSKVPTPDSGTRNLMTEERGFGSNADCHLHRDEAVTNLGASNPLDSPARTSRTPTGRPVVRGARRAVSVIQKIGSERGARDDSLKWTARKTVPSS